VATTCSRPTNPAPGLVILSAMRLFPGPTTAPAEQTDQASALINAARNTGGSIGISIVSNVRAHREQFHQGQLVEHAIPSSTQYQDTLSVKRAVRFAPREVMVRNP
jgi:hypothetical protein